MKRYAFTLPIPPSSNRWHRNVAGVVVTSKEARQYQERAAILALSQGVRQIRRPATVALEVTWYRGRKAGDLDKRLSVMIDALQGVGFENDSQIVKITATRIDGDASPRLEVVVQECAA